MKTKGINLTMIALLTLIISCSKSKDTTTPPVKPSIIGSWNFDGGTISGYTLVKEGSTNTIKFRSDNQLERSLNTYYQTSCTGAPGPCMIATIQFDVADTVAYTSTDNSVTFETDTWETTVTANTLILKVASIGDSLHFSR